MPAVLPENVGYLVLLGAGLAMAAAVTLMVRAETKWLGTRKTSEWFYTAGRTVKTGLIAASIVSAWTWAATLLQSSTVTFEFGVAGAFWYAAGASIQVILFSILAVELKRRAPMTHTFPEMLYVRYGRHGHKVFLFFALMANTVVTAMLVLGGAAVVNALTGVDITLAAFLIPAGIVAYTVFGGLKATFFAEYLNAGFIFVVVLVFVSVIYFASPEIGGVQGMYEKLAAASALRPVEGNAMGSFLTLASAGALVFGVINIVGNFGTVFVDQSYWQRAIAARPSAAAGGFVLGGLAWFAIPFALATALGLAAVATGMSLTEDEVGMGLVAPLAAAGVMGDAGAVLILAVVFTAVTAAGSSQLVSASSLMTYDVFRTYLKPSATGRELIRVSRLAILVFGAGMGLLASGLFYLGVGLQYVYLMMGMLVGPAVAPISLGILWGRTNRLAAIASAPAGLACGVLAWVWSASLSGEVTVASTGGAGPLLAGNVAGMLVSLAVVVAGSALRPERFDFGSLQQKIRLVDDRVRSALGRGGGGKLPSHRRAAVAIALILVVAWPAPFYATGYVFTPESFAAWVALAAAWAAGAAVAVTVLPAIEARASIAEILARAGRPKGPAAGEISAAKILVPVDGSARSLRALGNAGRVFGPGVEVYLLHVIEWPDDAGMDQEMSAQIREEGRLVLRSVSVPHAVRCRRIVKVGDPASKIAEAALSLDADMIAMGRGGLGGGRGMGRVARGVVEATSKPVVFLD